MTKLYPLYLRLNGEKCLVVGGGKVAARKVNSLLEAEATVTVVSPILIPPLAELEKKGQIEHIQRTYQEKDLEGAFLVICATDDKEVNRRVAAQCQQKKILVNVVNDPPQSNFFVPAVIRQGSLSIAVSTDGKSPLLAARIREQLEQTYGPEYADFLELLGEVRQDIIENVPDPETRREILQRIVQSDIISLIKENRYQEIKERVQNAYRSSGS
ncbi:bifunctional precorrin-2 dehydrogenase/sirohydrochlorin ferrochelatase [Peptococcaceae bacterium 1198_IL3148]